jgi:AGZA family xanthine/uracil permease-like MFS transporter
MHTQSTTVQNRFWGETTAFLALFLDNVGTLIFFSAILVFTFNYPADMILTRMIPGTAVGIFIGDIVYTWLALRLRKKTGRTDVTAMPLGIDTPSTHRHCIRCYGPAYIATRVAQFDHGNRHATLFLIGAVKIVTSFFGGWIQRVIPTARTSGAAGRNRSSTPRLLAACLNFQ